jgi:hypothetical protein
MEFAEANVGVHMVSIVQCRNEGAIRNLRTETAIRYHPGSTGSVCKATDEERAVPSP